MGTFDLIFIVMWVCCFIIRAPLEYKNKKLKPVESREGGAGKFLLMLVFTGSTTLPLLYLFTPWFHFADYAVPAWAGVIGCTLAAGGIFLFWKSHSDLGRQFSPMLEMKESHQLVSEGVYSRIRHPMYTALFAISAAQAFLIGNYVVGPAFLLTFSILYFSRIDNEEKMMLDHFGSAYADYQSRTHRLLPAFRK